MVGVAGLLLALGGCVSAPMPRERGASQETARVERKGTEIKFKRTLMGDGFNEGRRTSFMAYESDDGVKVLLSVETFPSPALARRELLRSVREAEKVLEHQRSINNRNPYEERASLILKSQDSSPKTAILWTSGRDLHFIESSSLRHALLFEKNMKPRVAIGE
jgi:hypothetical protein